MSTTSVKEALILSGAAVSNAVQMVGMKLVAIRQPADVEGTAFGLQASYDNGHTFTKVYFVKTEATGAAPVTAQWEVAKSATVTQLILLPDELKLVGPTHVKLVSEDGSNTASNQNADASCQLFFEDLINQR